MKREKENNEVFDAGSKYMATRLSIISIQTGTRPGNCFQLQLKKTVWAKVITGQKLRQNMQPEHFNKHRKGAQNTSDISEKQLKCSVGLTVMLTITWITTSCETYWIPCISFYYFFFFFTGVCCFSCYRIYKIKIPKHILQPYKS